MKNKGISGIEVWLFFKLNNLGHITKIIIPLFYNQLNKYP